MSQSKKQVSKAETPVKSEAKSLVNKLIEIRHGLGKVEKTKRNPHFGYSYVGLEQLNALLEPRLSELNILLTTSVVKEDTHYGATAKDGVFASVETEHTFIDGDSNQMIVGKSSGLGWDSGDKATAKAITAALKSYLKSNFMISDEADDTEAHGERPEGKPDAKGHKRGKPYEDETGEGNLKVAGDMLVLKTFLTEHKIPEGFLLRLLQDKALIDGHTKAVGQLKPGVVTRCITDKSKNNLLVAWKAYEADQDSGGATAPVPKGKKEKELPANEGNGNVVRTNEGDQTRNVPRKPVQNDMTPKETLEQDGYDNWRQVPIHFGEQKATPLGKLPAKSLAYWLTWKPKPYKGSWDGKDLLLDAALTLASLELSNE